MMHLRTEGSWAPYGDDAAVERDGPGGGRKGNRVPNEIDVRLERVTKQFADVAAVDDLRWTS